MRKGPLGIKGRAAGSALVCVSALPVCSAHLFDPRKHFFCAGDEARFQAMLDGVWGQDRQEAAQVNPSRHLPYELEKVSIASFSKRFQRRPRNPNEEGDEIKEEQIL